MGTGPGGRDLGDRVLAAEVSPKQPRRVANRRWAVPRCQSARTAFANGNSCPGEPSVSRQSRESFARQSRVSFGLSRFRVRASPQYPHAVQTLPRGAVPWATAPSIVAESGQNTVAAMQPALRVLCKGSIHEAVVPALCQGVPVECGAKEPSQLPRRLLWRQDSRRLGPQCGEQTDGPSTTFKCVCMRG